MMKDIFKSMDVNKQSWYVYIKSLVCILIGGVTGTRCFENEVVTVNCIYSITKFFSPDWNNINLEGMWFQ